MKARWLDRRIAAPGPYLALCTKEAQLAQLCRKLHVTPPAFITNSWSGATAHVFDTPSDVAVIVCIKVSSQASPIEIAGLLVHEAVHVWQEYVDRIGERSPGREQEAYAIQCIAQELMTEYARQVGEEVEL